MLTNDEIEEASKEISKLIQSAQNDMSIAESLRVEAPTEALTRCEAAIDSFKQVLKLFFGAPQYDDSQLTSIKSLLIESYQLQANIYEQYGMSKARYCYTQVEKLQEQDWVHYFSDELEDNDYLNDFDIEHTLEALHIDDATKEEQLKLPNITMAAPKKRRVAKDSLGGNHEKKERKREEPCLEQITQSMSSCSLNDTDSDKEGQFTAEQDSSLSPPKVKRGKKKSVIDTESAELHIDYTKLGELLSIANDDTILAVWQHKVTEAIETFLNNIKHKVVKGKKLKPRSVLISYYVDGDDNLGIKSMTELLAYLLQTISMPVNIKPLTDNCEDLEQDVQAHKLVIVLCDPAYAQQVERFPKIREILDDFGKSKKDCLHTLLCEGGFADTALKVVDKYYLIRDYKLAF